MEKQTKLEIEAATFRRIIAHFQKRTDAQNIDLMGLAGFCRNCFSKWYAEEALNNGIEIDKQSAREIIYGMPYDEWSTKYQTAATEKQLKLMNESIKKNN
ncbi:MAG: DUF1244 domain-containing protein [Kordiimonadaceae bacterium]|jgi:hypothetical protein|nr:DUF1244 domain-containing protein [Kordiimonadaceae bacterium]MDC1429644.1 DUF1244 domain-containing protein [Emcibacteraceae bacterium]MBT6133876.1 DUF1244 domain-containing protein [Kordiimonadaceae bacterium]MBT6467348.1 DUF1244 domain-containing protein [Kordiimonadaceae bacterium]MBT7545697.1 DUF1244 domain-containing protein [Kordiimonadaceae bacterium]